MQGGLTASALTLLHGSFSLPPLQPQACDLEAEGNAVQIHHPELRIVPVQAGGGAMSVQDRERVLGLLAGTNKPFSLQQLQDFLAVHGA